jgi:hypothetical protein
MQSFFFAETLKYFSLLFAPPEKIPIDSIVFHPEAHHFRRCWQRISAGPFVPPQRTAREERAASVPV